LLIKPLVSMTAAFTWEALLDWGEELY